MTQGTAAEVKANEEVIEAYLGGGLKNKKSQRKPLRRKMTAKKTAISKCLKRV